MYVCLQVPFIVSLITAFVTGCSAWYRPSMW